MEKTAKWDLFQLDLQLDLQLDTTFANPFTAVELQAEFSNGEQVYRVDGFYDGMEGANHVWRVRFSPGAEGIWSYKTFSNEERLDQKEGSFLCTEAVSRGGLTIGTPDGHWFARADGSPQLVVNDGWYPHAANGSWVSYEEVEYRQPSEEDMEDFIDLLAENGVNLFVDMGQLYARQKSITDVSFQWPWKVVDAEHNKIDRDSFNLLYYRRMERMLSYAMKQDVFFALELLFDNSVVRKPEWSHHPINAENGGWLSGDEWGLGWSPMFDLQNKLHVAYTEKYIRYTIARLSGYRNVCWEIGGENANLSQLPEWMLAHAQVPNERVAEWYNYWGDYIKEKDIYQRLCTYGDTTYMHLMVKGPGNDFILTQDPRNYRRDDVREYYKAMSRYGAFYWQFGRPVVIGEMNSFNNGNYGRERRLYWTAMVSGYMMGRSDRHFGIMNDGALVESEKFGVEGIPPIYPQLKIMREYVEQKVTFWRMKPSNELLTVSEEYPVFCLSEEGESYLIYFLFGGEAQMTLPAVEGEWLNPRTGERNAVKSLDAGTHTLTAPDGQDWVLYVHTAKDGNK